jgi:hypothetical protein
MTIRAFGGFRELPGKKAFDTASILQKLLVNNGL